MSHELETTRNASHSKPKRVLKKIRNAGGDIQSLLENDKKYKESVSLLPSNYDFEIEKTISKILSVSANIVALQFPEGLQMYACILSEIISTYGKCKIFILGDVTYGACCVDDYTASKLGADLLVHYGHSCLVSLQSTKIKVLYVFVTIGFETSHLSETLKRNFNSSSKISLMGTVQFLPSLRSVFESVKNEFTNINIPQCKPLSSGETLGCTSSCLPADCDTVIFVADGRFHLEAVMIQNPHVSTFRYDPYIKILTREGYDIEKMKNTRLKSISMAQKAGTFGLILGTLGRQGNVNIFQRINKLLRKHGKVVIPFLMAELNPAKLTKIAQIEVWVQVACPRLSVDWGADLPTPMLSPYEVYVALGEQAWQENYPMDYYSNNGGEWTNYFHST